MAIFHYSTQVASRSAGKSAIAMAAYRSGDKLYDERTGELKFYRRDQQPEAVILAPANAPEWVQDRNRLWNEVEKAEKRKDAQVCREINVALPRELDVDAQRELLLQYCQEQFVDRGMIADVAIHRDNPENPHAHIMLTMRDVTPEGFGKKNREWNPDFAFGRVRNSEKYVDWRAAWADHANRALDGAGISERIDHRSLAQQGITDREPTIHEGPTVRQMEERGVETDRGNINRMVQDHNTMVVYLNKYRREKETLLQQKNQQPPQERRMVSQAEKILGQPARLENVRAGIGELTDHATKLQTQLRQLQEQEKPFQIAEQHFRSLDQWKPLLKDSSGFSRLFSKEQRESHRALQTRIQETEDKLQAMGFPDREQFEARKAKVMSYNEEQRQDIHQKQARISEAKDVLLQTEKAIQKAEIQRVADAYPGWPGAKHLQYPEAEKIHQVNDQAGRVLQPSEMQQLFDQGRGSPGGLQIVKGALDAFDQATRRAAREQEQKQWQERKKNRDRGR